MYPARQVFDNFFFDEFLQEFCFAGHVVHGLSVHGSHAEVVVVVQRCAGLIQVIAKPC